MVGVPIPRWCFFSAVLERVGWRAALPDPVSQPRPNRAAAAVKQIPSVSVQVCSEISDSRFIHVASDPSPSLSTRRCRSDRQTEETGPESTYWTTWVLTRVGSADQTSGTVRLVWSSDGVRLMRALCTAEFSDASAKFYCRIYYAEEFHKMREEIMESSEEDFVRSLSHCVNWQARGGKSGAVFYATEGLVH